MYFQTQTIKNRKQVKRIRASIHSLLNHDTGLMVLHQGHICLKPELHLLLARLWKQHHSYKRSQVHLKQGIQCSAVGQTWDTLWKELISVSQSTLSDHEITRLKQIKNILLKSSVLPTVP